MTPPAGHTALSRAAALLDWGRPAQAAELVTPLLAEDPSDTAAWQLLARCRTRLGDPAGAVEATDEALRTDPTDVQTWCLRAAALRDLGRPHEALDAADEAVRLAPEAWHAHHLRAAALNDQPRNPERTTAAYRAAVQATTLGPDEPDAHHAVGVTALRFGRAGRPVAAAAFRTCLTLDPHHTGAHQGLAVLAVHRSGTRATADVADHCRAILAADPLAPAAPRWLTVLANLLLHQARLALLAAFLLAGATRGITVALSDAGPVIVWGIRLTILAALLAVGLWAVSRCRQQIPAALHRPLRHTFGQSPVLITMAVALAPAALAALALLTIPPVHGPAGAALYLGSAAITLFSGLLAQRL